MSKLYNRARMTVTSTGTGSLSLGVAVAGYQTFSSSGAQNGDTISYTIEDGLSWEIGTGSFNSVAGTLSRTVTQSFDGTTYGTSAISVTTAAQVFITALAADLTTTDTLTSGTLPVTRGGTGVATLTGIVKASGTSAFTAATAGTDYVAPGGALGTPASGNLTNCTFPTLNQNTTGTASNITGTLAVSQGGTGATATTGSGSNVLATSPTLVSPALGIPVSGNLVNCTFPTLNQNTTGTAANVTGTVAVANGGTGATTAANAIANLNAISLTAFFGTGQDGAGSISGALTLSRDMHYSSLTINAGASINTNGWRIFVRGALTLSSAPTKSFYCNGGNGGAGGAGVNNINGTSGGNAGASSSSGYTAPGSGSGWYGYPGYGGAAGPGNGGATNSQINGFGTGNGGNGGKGGNIGAYAGGAGDTWTLAATVPWTIKDATNGAFIWASGLNNIGGGGGSGAVNGATQSPGAGGGGGGGGGIVYIAAQSIVRGANASIIQAIGGNGGAGGNGIAATGAAGGGGGGGGGGAVIIIYGTISGSVNASAINVSGGSGGAAGGVAGTTQAAGQAGYSGAVYVVDASAGTVTFTAAIAATTSKLVAL